MAVSPAGSMPGMIPTPCTTDAPLAAPDHPALAVLPDVPTRDEIEAFGRFLQSLEAQHETPDIPTAHYFAGAQYGRSVTIPAGVFLVGLPHKSDHLNVAVGDITVWTEDGRRRFTGAQVIPGRAGVMRVGFTHSDTTWLSVHHNPTGDTDLAGIEAALVEHPDRLMSRRVPALGGA